MKKNEALACQYFKRVAKIEKLEKESLRLRKKNKKILKLNPWIGNLIGLARKSKAEGSDSSISYSSGEEEVKKGDQKKKVLPVPQQKKKKTLAQVKSSIA